MRQHVSRKEAYDIIVDSFTTGVTHIAKKYGRKPTTIRRVLSDPEYAEWKAECEDALRQRGLERLLSAVGAGGG